MAKGVKKISLKGTAKVVAVLSEPNVKIGIPPDQETFFEVEQWHKNTPEEDKKKAVTWTIQDRKKRKIIVQRVKPAGEPFSIKLSRNLCGPFKYYVEASLYGKPDYLNQTGLYVQGACTPKIMGSKWCKSNDGDDARKDYTFSYGQTIYLNLETEGINGHQNITVEVYKLVGGGVDDPCIYKYVSVDVIDGEICLEINNTYSWFSSNLLENYYVKVYDPVKKKHITDSNNDTEHARFLRIQNKIVSKEIKESKSLSPLKMGAPEKNYARYDFCKYNIIKQTYKGKETTIFDEEELKKGKKPGDSLPFHFITGNTTNKATVKLTKVKLCDHHKTDFIIVNNKSRLKLNKTNNENFSFDVVFPYKNTDDYGAFLDNYFLISVLVKEILSPIRYGMPLFYPLNPLITQTIELAEAYEAGIKYAPISAVVKAHTCRYQQLLDIKIYPDVAWSYHFQLGEPNRDALYKNIDVKLNKGLKDLFKGIRNTYDKFGKYLPYQVPYLSRIAFDIMCDILEEQAEEFSVGFHAYYNFDETGKPAKIMDYSEKYNTVAKSIIAAELAGWVVIQALILYITKGGGTVTKAGKVEKIIRTANKVGSLLDKVSNKLDFIMPQISRANGFRNERQKDGRVALVFEEKIVASPLFALEYLYETSLGQFVADATPIGTAFDIARNITKIWGYFNKAKDYKRRATNAKEAYNQNKKVSDAVKGAMKSAPETGKPDFKTPSNANDAIDAAEDYVVKKIDELDKEYGQEISLTISCIGFIDAKIETRVNLLTNTIHLKDGIGEYYSNQKNNNEVVFGNKKGIDAIVKLTGKSVINFRPNKMYDYFPKWVKGVGPQMPEYSSSTDISGELKGTFYYERKYKFNLSKQPVYQDYVIFSGVKGFVKLKVILQKNKDRTWELPKDYQNIQFELIPPFIEEGKEIPLFNKPNTK